MELSKREQQDFMLCMRVEQSFRQELEHLVNEGADEETLIMVMDNAWVCHCRLEYYQDARLNRLTDWEKIRDDLLAEGPG